MIKINTFGFLKKAITMATLVVVSACASGSGGGISSDLLGNENGSTPINENESQEYKKAIVRCYKTGGNRVVKIMGTLRCY